MRILVVCKRRSSMKDLLSDRFGRYFHLPTEMRHHGMTSLVLAADYESRVGEEISIDSTRFISVPLTIGGVRTYSKQLTDYAREFEPSVVLAGGDIHFGWFGRRLARDLLVPFVFDVFDNYETFASSKAPGMKKLFRMMSNTADLTVVVSSALGDHLGLEGNFCVIPNGVDMDLFRPLSPDRTAFADRNRRPNARIGYVGGLARDRGISTLIDAVALLRRSGRNVDLSIAGPLISGFEMRDEPWIEYRGFIEQSEVPAFIGNLDVAVLPYPDSDWARYTSAYKVQEYLACEVPIVVTDIAEYRELAPSPEAVSRPEDPQDLARALDFQLAHRRVVPRDEHWSWRSRAGELVAEIRSLV